MPGAGLGLAIAQGFAEANGGRVWVESQRGQGATFVARIAGRRRPGAGMSARVLVVDDEQQILRALRTGLRAAGYDVDVAETAEGALTAAALRPPDAMILDLILPDGTGTEVCRELRSWSTAPVIILSAVGEEREKIAALDAGADDYVTKPVSIDELLARLRAVLRRAAPSGEPVIRSASSTVDLEKQELHIDGKPVHVTPHQFDLLRRLARNEGKLMTHRMLLQEVWGPGYGNESNLLRVHVAQLRRRIESDPRTPPLPADGARRRLPARRSLDQVTPSHLLETARSKFHVWFMRAGLTSMSWRTFAGASTRQRAWREALPGLAVARPCWSSAATPLLSWRVALVAAAACRRLALIRVGVALRERSRLEQVADSLLRTGARPSPVRAARLARGAAYLRPRARIVARSLGESSRARAADLPGAVPLEPRRAAAALPLFRALADRLADLERPVPRAGWCSSGTC